MRPGPALEDRIGWPGSPTSCNLNASPPNSPAQLPSRSSTGKLGKSNFNDKEGLSKEGGECLPPAERFTSSSTSSSVESRGARPSCGLWEVAGWSLGLGEGQHTQQPL